MNSTGGPSPVIPSQFNPKPNGASTATQAPVQAAQAPSATPAPAPAIQSTSEVETLKAKLAEATQREVQAKREMVMGKQQHQREKQTWGEKLKNADAYERMRKLATVDKIAAAKELFGDKWHEELNLQAANGGAPSAEAVRMAIEESERRGEERIKAQQAEAEKAAQAERQKQTEARLRAHTSQAVEWAKANEAEYPIFKQFKSPERAAGAIVQRQRDVYESTTQRDEQTGQVLATGKVITFKEAAELVEADLISIAEEAAAAEKYRQRLSAKLTPQKQVGTVPAASKSSPSQSLPSQSSQSESQGRRSLSNDMTGSTLERPAEPLTDDERMKRSIARYHEYLAAKNKA